MHLRHRCMAVERHVSGHHAIEAVPVGLGPVRGAAVNGGAVEISVVLHRRDAVGGMVGGQRESPRPMRPVEVDVADDLVKMLQQDTVSVTKRSKTDQKHSDESEDKRQTCITSSASAVYSTYIAIHPKPIYPPPR